MEYGVAAKAILEMRETDEPELLRDVYLAAVRYAQMRAEWRLASTDGRKEMDASRTRAHDAFITTLNVLARSHARSGRSIAWRASLGNERKTLGDFACYIALILAIEAR